MSGNGGAGPTEQYCPECGSVVDRSARACPHCGTDRVASTGDAGGSGRGGAGTGTDDPRQGSGGATESGSVRGLLYAAIGAVLMVLSVLTFVEGILTFSLLIGILLLPLAGLFGIAGTLLGYYSAVAYRSKLGVGVGLVGTLEALAVVGSVVLAILTVLGVVAVASPFGLLAELVELIRWILEQVFGLTGPVVA